MALQEGLEARVALDLLTQQALGAHLVGLVLLAEALEFGLLLVLMLIAPAVGVVVADLLGTGVQAQAAQDQRAEPGLINLITELRVVVAEVAAVRVMLVVLGPLHLQVIMAIQVQGPLQEIQVLQVMLVLRALRALLVREPLLVLRAFWGLTVILAL